MSPIKKNATKKPSKCPCISSDSFWNDDADMAFNDHYKRAPIILERTVDLEERTWTKLLNPMGNVYKDVFENSSPMPLWKEITSTVG